MPQPDPESSSSPFTPSSSGFYFANRFPGAPIPFTDVGHGRSAYGLCGGMCFAALDYLYAGQPLPRFSAVPEKNTRFWRYLYKRQIDSFGPGMWLVLKYALWTVLPRVTVHRRTVKSLGQVRRMVASGDPVVLGVIYVGLPDSLAVWQNHQVIVYRIEDPAPNVADLYIYDPNHPGDDSDFIRCTQVDLAGQPAVLCHQRSSRREPRSIRGIFPVRYQTAVPPTFPPELFNT